MAPSNLYRTDLCRPEAASGQASWGRSSLEAAASRLLFLDGAILFCRASRSLSNKSTAPELISAADTIVPRLIAAGADLRKVHIIHAVRNEDGKGLLWVKSRRSRCDH